MSTPYEVKSGDWLQKIAEEHGFESWRDLYYHEDNAAFRAKRPNPDKIYPGDVIMIPDKVPPGGDTPPGGDKPEKPKPKPKGEDQVVTAEPFDTLCSIAVEHGFADCAKLRAHPDNKDYLNRPLKPGEKVTVPGTTEGDASGSTEAKHTFQRRGKPMASIRFVHGSRTLPCKDDIKLNHIDVSNYPTHLAGADRKKPFVDHNVTGFEQHADDDVDTFKVEVFDLRTKKKKMPVELDALCPVYKVSGAIEKHEEFTGDRKTAGTEAAKHSLDSEVEQQSTTRRFRSCYLRLVVDDFDQGTSDPKGRKKQTLLVSDLSAAAAGEADKTKAAKMRQVEILDQQVRARYVLDGCPAPGSQMQCRVETAAPVGHDKKRVRLAVHVMRKTRTGAGVVTKDEAEEVCRKFLRRFYAQADMSFKFVAPKVQLVPPPQNMITIADGTGAVAAGGGKIRVEIDVDGTKHTVEITTVLNKKPIDTANLLKSAIAAKFGATVKVKATKNPKLGTHPHGTADVIVGTPMTQKITITDKTAAGTGDAKHTIRITRLTGTGTLTEYNPGAGEINIGTRDERILIKNYDTGKNRIDLFVVEDLSWHSWGEAFWTGARTADAKAIDEVVNSVIVRRKPIDDPANSPIVLVPHEFGHVLMDMGAHSHENTELMFEKVGHAPFIAKKENVDAPKRIFDPDNAHPVKYDGDASAKPVKYLREHNKGLLANW